MKKGDTLHRLKIIEGHLKKVIRMVEDSDYCIDILNQSLAVQKALKKVDEKILEKHLNTCVKDAFSRGTSEKSIEEIIKIFEKK